MASEKIKIVVENHQSGNKMFPGYKNKYPELYDIPKNTAGEAAIIIDVDEDDLDEIQAALANSGVGCRKYKDIPENQVSFFQRLLGKTEEEPPPSPPPPVKREPEVPPEKRWKAAFKKLTRDQKKQYKDVKFSDLSDVEVEEVVSKIEALVNPK